MPTARYHGQVIFCRDVPTTASLYENALGLIRGPESGGDISMRACVADHPDATVEIYLHPTQDTPQPAVLGTFDLETTADISSTIDALCRAGSTLTKPPADTPWGTREATVTDPNGHQITLSAPLP